MRKRIWRGGPALLATALLIAVTLGGTLLAMGHIHRAEEQAAFRELENTAQQLASTVLHQLEDDRRYLQLAAEIAAGFDDLTDPALWDVLAGADCGMVSELELLLPDDTVVTAGGRTAAPDGTRSFAAEAALGAHLSDRVTGRDGSPVLRHAVPVVRDGETVAVLCGVTELGALPGSLFPSYYGGDMALYLIDGATGDFLLDTWHPGEAGNIWDLGTREMAPGYDDAQPRQDLTEGRSGYVVFVSETTGSYLYFYFQPLPVNEWRLALSVPEAAVFRGYDTAGRALAVFLAFEAVCFAVYLAWMVRFARQETREKQRQLDALHYTYQVGQLLFNAHVTPERLQAALAEIGRILEAGQVAFWSQGADASPLSYQWAAAGAQPPALDETLHSQVARRLAAYFLEGHDRVMANRPAEVAALLPREAAAAVRTLAAIAIRDEDDALVGVLAAYNAPPRSSNLTYLSQVGLSFGMLCRNLAELRAVRARGERDALTGLLNRNRYEADLPACRAHSGPMGCVYADLDGLHSLNNTRGHEAGDEMLRTAAEVLVRTFGDGRTYRLGGDEFLAFLLDVPEVEVRSRAAAATAALAARGIRLSAGAAWTPSLTDLDALIRTAEQEMYREKSSGAYQR